MSSGVERTEVDLRLGQPLLGGEAKPTRGLVDVPRNTVSVAIKQPKVVLGMSIALLGCLTPEPDSGRIVAVLIGRESFASP